MVTTAPMHNARTIIYFEHDGNCSENFRPNMIWTYSNRRDEDTEVHSEARRDATEAEGQEGAGGLGVVEGEGDLSRGPEASSLTVSLDLGKLLLLALLYVAYFSSPERS